MKTYKITQIANMLVTHRITAETENEALGIASARTKRLCEVLESTRSGIKFIAIETDFVHDTANDLK